MGFLTGFAKYILFIFNVLILIAAIAFIAVGAIYHSKNTDLDIKSVGAFTIAVGVIIALISFFGCCGAIKESRCLLTTYAFIMITIFVVQVVLIVLAFLATKNDNFELDKEVRKYLEPIYEKRSQGIDMDAVDNIQKEFECCTVNRNWTLVEIDTTGRLIDSCCESEYKGRCNIDNAYGDCIGILRDFIESYAKLIGGIAIGVAIVEIVAAIFAFCVRGSIGKHAY